MVSKKVRQRVKSEFDGGKTPEEIAQELGISAKVVSEALDFYGRRGQPNSYLSRKNFLIGGVALALSGLAGAIYLFYNPTYSPLTTSRPKIENLTPLQKFETLPQYAQDEVLSQLERYILSTGIGKTAQGIIDAIKVPETEVLATPRGAPYEYEPLENKILYKKVPNTQLVDWTLRGSLYIVAKAHERLHYLQDVYSEWDKFESFLKNIKKSIKRNKTTYELTPQEVEEFSKNVLGNFNLPHDKVIDKLSDLVNKLYDTKSDMRLIREVQAYLSLEPFNLDRLYNMLTQREYKDNLGELDRKRFNQVYGSTLELVALLPPIEAAKFVGRNGNSIDDYTKAVETLKTMMGVQDASLKGAQRQVMLAKDLEAIRYVLEGFIHETYLKYRTN